MLENMKRWGIADETTAYEPLTPAQEVEILPFCLRLSRRTKVGLPTVKIIPMMTVAERKVAGCDETFAQNATGKILRELGQGRKQGIDAKLKFIMPYGDIFLNEEATELVETRYLTQLLRVGYQIEAW
jgi:hypothetical protein